MYTFALFCTQKTLAMTPTNHLVFATNNAHKLAEAAAILDGAALLSTPAQHNVREEIPETQPTIIGNALQKARYVYDLLQINCFADDTGLEVDALQGAPGVHSARYAGISKDMSANRQKLLHEMRNIKNPMRSARFRTVVALVFEGKEYIFEGIVNGAIAEQEAGVAGFGYDTLFLPKGYSQTFAEMDVAQKNAISHRSIALRKMKEWLATNIS
jgi:XTP/dITP diphosphohydrolase